MNKPQISAGGTMHIAGNEYSDPNATRQNLGGPPWTKEDYVWYANNRAPPPPVDYAPESSTTHNTPEEVKQAAEKAGEKPEVVQRLYQDAIRSNVETFYQHQYNLMPTEVRRKVSYEQFRKIIDEPGAVDFFSTMGFAGVAVAGAIIAPSIALGGLIGLGMSEGVSKITTGQFLSTEEVLPTIITGEALTASATPIARGIGAITPEIVKAPLRHLGFEFSYMFRQHAPGWLLEAVYGQEGKAVAIERAFPWSEEAWGMEGFSQVPSEEAFMAQQSLIMRSPTIAKIPSPWYIHIVGEPITPMSATLARVSLGGLQSVKTEWMRFGERGASEIVDMAPTFASRGFPSSIFYPTIGAVAAFRPRSQTILPYSVSAVKAQLQLEKPMANIPINAPLPSSIAESYPVTVPPLKQEERIRKDVVAGGLAPMLIQRGFSRLNLEPSRIISPRVRLTPYNFMRLSQEPYSVQRGVIGQKAIEIPEQISGQQQGIQQKQTQRQVSRQVARQLLRTPSLPEGKGLFDVPVPKFYREGAKSAKRRKGKGGFGFSWGKRAYPIWTGEEFGLYGLKGKK